MIFRTRLIRNAVIRVSLCIALFCSLLSGTLQANPDQALIQKIKTAFVFNIAKFVDWPETVSQHSFSLCHYRANTLRSGIQSLSGKKIHGLTVTEHKVRSLDEATECHILFIPRDQLEQFNAEQWRIADSYIMTIADLTGLAEQRSYESNAIINLIRRGSRVGLEVNLNEVRNTPLRISSELLKLARVRR